MVQSTSMYMWNECRWRRQWTIVQRSEKPYPIRKYCRHFFGLTTLSRDAIIHLNLNWISFRIIKTYQLWERVNLDMKLIAHWCHISPAPYYLWFFYEFVHTSDFVVQYCTKFNQQVGIYIDPINISGAQVTSIKLTNPFYRNNF